MALSLYNKYRPQTFKDVVGQDHVERTLENAVEKNTVSHAYLFCGPRGTGKTTTARILAKALLCEKGPTAQPDGSCSQCEAISNGIHPDVYELDAASRTGVDNVREEIIGRVNFAPTQGKHKIYIIDEVHMLSKPAFNALLKTLEEPPEHVVFILCTTDVHAVPDTVQARCQRFDFKRISAADIVGRLSYICEQESFDCESAALELIARRSQGGMRDAIRSLEQAAVFSSGKITYTAAESLLGMVDAEQLFVLCNNLALGDAAACFDWVAAYVQNGSDIAVLVNDLARHVRNLYAVSVARGSEEHLISALEIDAATLPLLREQAAMFSSPERLSWMLTVFGSLSAELKHAANARLALEVALTRVLRPESELSLEALAARVALLEERLASGGVSIQATAGTQSAAAGAQAAVSAQAATSQPAVVYESVVSPDASAPTSALQTSSVQEKEAFSGAPAAQEQASASSRDVAEQAVEQPAQNAAPEQAAAPGAQTGSPSLDDQALHRQWNETVDTIGKKKRGVAASLGGIAPRFNSSKTKLILEMPSDAATSKQYLETEANKELVRNTVEKCFGAALDIEFVLAVEAPVIQETFIAKQAPEPAIIEMPQTAEPLSAQPKEGEGAAPANNAHEEVAHVSTSTAEEVAYEESELDDQPLDPSFDEAAPAAHTAEASTNEASANEAPENEIPKQSETKAAQEPTKEELSNILGNSFGTITFEE